MRGSWMRRAGALWLALWMSVSLAERTAAGHCPEHDPVAAAIDAMAHHGMGAHAPAGGKHRCSCLEECCGPAVMVVPAAVAQHAAVPAAHVAPPAAASPESIPARPGTRLPFANGPPPALAA